jgi:hypothetical protein
MRYWPAYIRPFLLDVPHYDNLWRRAGNLVVTLSQCRSPSRISKQNISTGMCSLSHLVWEFTRYILRTKRRASSRPLEHCSNDAAFVGTTQSSPNTWTSTIPVFYCWMYRQWLHSKDVYWLREWGDCLWRSWLKDVEVIFYTICWTYPWLWVD